MSTVREWDFWRNFGEEEGTVIQLVLILSTGDGGRTIEESSSQNRGGGHFGGPRLAVSLQRRFHTN